MNVMGFYSPVIVDLGGIKAESQTMPAFLDHDSSQIVGQTDAVSIGSDGVDFSGTIMGEDSAAQRVISLAKNGFKWQASIGANIIRQEYLKAGEKATVNGREVSGPLLIARESRLFEISFVALGADSSTSANVAAKNVTSDQKGVHTMFETWLQAKGFDPATITDNQRAFLQAMFDAEESAKKPKPTPTPTPTPPGPPNPNPPGKTLAEILQAHKDEEDRIEQITQITAGALNERPWLYDDLKDMSAAAIAAKTSVHDYDIQVLRLRATTGTQSRRASSSSSTGTRTGPKVLEAAICIANRLPNKEKIFDSATLNAADERYPGGIGLNDLLMMAARENGWSGYSVRENIKPVLAAAFGYNGTIRAEFSTISLPGILSNVANKFLLAGFNAVEAGWRNIAAIRNVKDFKTNTSYSLTGGLVYEKVGPAGELKHGTIGELSYQNKAETYGKMFALTRQDIINDDLGALTEVPRKLGRGAALKLNDVFWTTFMNNATFFSAGHGNVITGATTNLGPTGLAAAQGKFKKLTDVDGLPIGIVPKILVVPVELEIAANELMTSTVVNTGGSATDRQVPNINYWSQKFTVVTSTYLSNPNYAGNSATAWYILADPNDLPVIEMCFLNGRETPIVETADADFNTLGIAMRGYHDFGCALQEYRAGVRSAGV
jgi:phage major head subunit gpT-like protein/phage head maturation protease